jgi:hypothetical protein
MNRDLQKLLQEKWFLVAADFIAVLGVLLIGFDPKDGLQAFLAVLGILGASLIVVIPVLKDGGGKAERQAEQARLRAALADEIDRLRDDIRATAEAGNRRIGEVELDARRQAEQAAAAATAVAQRASAEINALKSEVAALKATAAELEKKVAVAQRSAGIVAEESDDEAAQHQHEDADHAGDHHAGELRGDADGAGLVDHEHAEEHTDGAEDGLGDERADRVTTSGV